MAEDTKQPPSGSRRSDTSLWNRTIDQGEPNVLIGADGNSVFPGDAAKERKRRGNDRRFKGFPKVAGNSSMYDRERIKREYFESPVMDWEAYCATRGYNPTVRGLAYKSWAREKKYKEAWRGVTKEVEAAGTQLGPQNLLRALQAIKEYPETLSAMLQVCRHMVKTHYDEALSDTALAKKCQLEGKPVPRESLSFSLDALGAAGLSQAITKTGDALYKALGIDTSLGLDASKWMQLVEDQVSRVDGTQEAAVEEESMQVEIIGARDLRLSMREAMEKYLDKPRPPDVLEADEISAPLPEPEESVDPSEGEEDSFDGE